MPHLAAHPPVSRLRLAGGFAVIYVVWGSTYLGISWAVQTIPPLLMGGLRFLLAGLALYALLRIRGMARPTLRHWINAAVVGLFTLGGGNGLLCVAERTVPSGIAALVIGTTPVWMVGLHWAFFGGPRPRKALIVAIAVGFVSVALLAKSDPTPGSSGGAEAGAGAGGPGGHFSPWMVLVLVAGSASWALGSLAQRTVRDKPTLLLFAAMQMIAAGAVMALAGVARGEGAGFHPADISLRSLLAFIYLLVIGSWLAYSVYVWLLTVASPAAISTYSFVNPVVAVGLGWLLAHEPVNWRLGLATALTLGSILLISSTRRPAMPHPVVPTRSSAAAG